MEQPLKERPAADRKAASAGNQATAVVLGLFELFALLKYTRVLDAQGARPSELLITLLAAMLACAAFARADYYRLKASGLHRDAGELISRNLGIVTGAGIVLGVFPPLYLALIPPVLLGLFGVAWLIAGRRSGRTKEAP